MGTIPGETREENKMVGKIVIVTDSGADIPKEITKDLGIIVVPLHIIFGKQDFLDGFDIKEDELYRRLKEGPIYPTTSTASPGEFVQVYREIIANGAESIISIHITSKLSKTHSSAVQAGEIMKNEGTKCAITVIDSEAVTLGMGLLVMMAAKMVKDGKDFNEIVTTVQEYIPRIHLIGALDTLKYLIKGGRAPKIALITGPLKIKTFLKLANGKLHLLGATRTQHGKMKKIIDFIRQFSREGLMAISVEYSTEIEECRDLKKEIEATFPGVPVYFSQLGAAVGVHGGPGTIIVGVLAAAGGVVERIPARVNNIRDAIDRQLMSPNV
jgi:DegV family protein with EDD domain